MTLTLALSARQITAICKGAAKAGFIAELVIGDIVVRLKPDPSIVQATQPNASNQQTGIVMARLAMMEASGAGRRKLGDRLKP